MRFESLSLRIPGDQLSVHFHERVTVLGGLGAVERQGFVEALLAAVTGGHGNTELVVVGASGRRMRVEHDGGEPRYVYEDGSPANPLEVPTFDVDTLRRLCRLGPAELGLALSEIDMRGVPQLAEAQEALQRLSEDLEAAFASHHAAKAMLDEIDELDDRLRLGEQGWAERRYAALLADLDQVRAEAAALRRAQANGGEATPHFQTLAAEAQELGRRWAQADARRRQLLEQFGGRRRLDAATLALTPPETNDAPIVIDGLVRALEDAERRRDVLTSQLQDQTVSSLGQPAHPAVVQLARADQGLLWHTAQRAVDASERLEEQSLAFGGVRTDGVSSPIAQEIESAHEDVVRAERIMEDRKRAGFLASGGAALVSAATVLVSPMVSVIAIALAVVAALWMLVVPRRAFRKYTDVEREVLDRAGVATYLSFHLRRIEATVDPRARQKLAEATAAHQEALADWHRIAGPITPVQALALKEEVAAYAKEMAGATVSPSEMDAVRRELVQQAEPALEAAMQALLEACQRYGVDDPASAIEVARQQTETGVIARLQRDLELAEGEEHALRIEVERRLAELGFDGDDVAVRLDALERAILMAAEPEAPWTSTRSLAEVEAELAELDARARQERPATWGTASGAAALVDEQELEELRARRTAIAEAYALATRDLPDIADLADRRSALERRVTTLEASATEDAARSVRVTAADVQERLSTWLDQMAQATPHGDLLPVLLDDPFSRIRGEGKWEILDAVESLAQRTQVIFLTDDSDVVLWARRRASRRTLRLLEPNGAAV